jgi:hypothetical protein
MPEIHEVTVITANPTGPGDVGSCHVGHYTVDGGLLTMVTADGVPMRAANGERITAHMRAGDSARSVASRMVLSHWRATDGAASDFNRPLHYRSAGWV